MFSCVFFSRSLDRQWASCHCPQKWSCRTPWAHILCWGRTWPDSQTSRPRAEMRMSCAFRTGEYGKNVWTGKSRERRQQKMGETWEGEGEIENKDTHATNIFFMNLSHTCMWHAWRCADVTVHSLCAEKCACNRCVYVQKWYLHGPMIWKFMQRNASKDIANLREKQLSKCTKSQRHAWMIITSKKKKMDQLENCPQFAHKLFWNVYTWHVLGDLIFNGLWTNLLVR